MLTENSIISCDIKWLLLWNLKSIKLLFFGCFCVGEDKLLAWTNALNANLSIVRFHTNLWPKNKKKLLWVGKLFSSCSGVYSEGGLNPLLEIFFNLLGFFKKKIPNPPLDLWIHPSSCFYVLKKNVKTMTYTPWKHNHGCNTSKYLNHPHNPIFNKISSNIPSSTQKTE